MPNSSSCRVEINPLLFGKFFDIPIFAKVRLAHILDIVVKGHDNLRWVVDLGRADGHEFLFLCQYQLLYSSEIQTMATGHELSWVIVLCGCRVT
jgi:hypothetical protein